MKVICFHSPDEENGYLSNWYPSPLTFGGTGYSSMEQYMMHQKALTFGDSVTAGKILATDNAGKIKALGRKVSGYDEIIWNGVRQIVVYNGLLEKFRQNDTMREMLLATGDSLLAECAVLDRIWGIGLSMTDDHRYDPSFWKGQNLLGFALMCVRSALSEQ